MIDPTTARAEEIRESTGMAWEHACLQAERERDAAATAPRPDMLEPFTLRMLGQYVTLSRCAWLELLDELRADSELAERIRRRVAAS